MTDQQGLDTLQEAKQEAERLSGRPPTPASTDGPPGQRALRPYMDPRLAGVKPGQEVKVSVEQTLQRQSAEEQRIAASGEEAERGRAAAAQESRVRLARQQDREMAEVRAGVAKVRLEATRGELESRLSGLAADFMLARGALPIGDEAACLDAVTTLREKLGVAAALARRLEGAETDCFKATAQWQAAAWRKDHPDDPQDAHWEVKIAHADAGRSIRRTAADFMRGVALPAEVDCSVSEMAGPGAAATLSRLAARQRELMSQSV